MLCLNLLINTDPSISRCPTHPFSHLKITPRVAWWGKSSRWYGAIFNWGKKAEPEPSTEDNDRGKTALCLPWARGNYGGALLRGYYCRLKWCRSPWLSQMSPLGGGKWEDLPSSRSSISLPLFPGIPAGFWQQRGAAPRQLQQIRAPAEPDQGRVAVVTMSESTITLPGSPWASEKLQGSHKASGWKLAHLGILSNIFKAWPFKTRPCIPLAFNSGQFEKHLWN